MPEPLCNDGVPNKDKSRDDVIDLMEQKIKELGPEKVSKHCSDTHFVIDVARFSDKEKEQAFSVALENAKKDGGLTKYIVEDRAYHIEMAR